MNFSFSLTHNNLVAETLWFGNLNHEILVDGIVHQNQWILQNSNRLPLVLVSDYTMANLNQVAETELQKIAEQFHGLDDLFPDMTWVAIMPGKITYDIVRVWQEHAESLFKNSQVVRNWSSADKIINKILANYKD